MNIDYNDQRFQQVNQEKQTRLNEINDTYNNMINQSEQYYNNLANEAERYGNQQQQLQQQRTDFAIDKIEQQKDWAKQDYTKEQKGAYQDYAKQINNYGINAEQMAQNGLLGTGYAESSKVGMYNAYQNRVATARESYNRAVVDYDNAIKDAQLANNSTLAELAHNTLQTKLELALQGFQYKNDLIKTKLAAQNENEDRYYSRWQDVLQQVNNEAALAASVAAAKSKGSKSGGYTGLDLGTDLNNETNNQTTTTLSAVMTPQLSTKAYSWYNKNFRDGMTLDEINQAIAKGLASGNLKESDKKKIYAAYQIELPSGLGQLAAAGANAIKKGISNATKK